MVEGTDGSTTQVMGSGNLTSETNVTSAWDYDKEDLVIGGNVTEDKSVTEGNITDIGNTTAMVPGGGESIADGVITEDTASFGEERSLLSEEEGGWPLRQIEIAIGVILFILVSALLFTRIKRRSLASI